MNRLIPAADKSARLQQLGSSKGIPGRVSGGVLLSIALLTAGGALPIAAADPGTPVVVNCSRQPEVKPQSILLTCADNTWAVDKITWDQLERRCWRKGHWHRTLNQLRSELRTRLADLFSGYDYAHRRCPSQLSLHQRGNHQPKHRHVQDCGAIARRPVGDGASDDCRLRCSEGLPRLAPKAPAAESAAQRNT